MPKLTDQEMIHAATDIMRTLGISEKHIRQFEQSGTVCLHVSGRVVAVYRGTNLFEMIAAVMESKYLGLCTKAVMVVPNHLTQQTAAEFLRKNYLY